MMNRKIITVLICAAFIGILAGCGSNSSTEQEEKAEGVVETVVVSDTEPEEAVDSLPAENTETEGKVLVVYYSATGHTETAAHTIAEAMDADIFELEPVEPYTEEDLDWTNDDSRVSAEHNAPDDRNVELTMTTVDDWESYDTVLIGYPVWWGEAAWPVDGFVKANDFTGKTVIPFCTSSSSGMGESGKLLAEMAGTGDWLEGERFSSGASAEEVQAWAESLEQ